MDKRMELAGLLKHNPLLRPQGEALEELLRRREGEELILSVIGQFKRGKSSLINSFLASPVLPVGIIPLTTAVTELRWGPVFRGEVLLTDGTVRDITADALEDYCSEQKNPGNRKGVRAVRLWTPDHPFGPGVVLVDTPGVGSVHQNNTDASYDYVAQSDVVLFLLSVDSPVSETERAFLLNARQYAARFFFVVNKADTVSPAELAEFTAFCEGVIGESMETAVRLYPISARTGAGLEELKQLLNRELSASKSQLLEASLLRKRDLLLEQLRAKLKLAEQGACLPAEELRGKLARLEDRKRELAEFADGLEVLTDHRTQRLADQIREPLDREAETLKSAAAEYSRTLQQRLNHLPTGAFQEQLQGELERFLRNGLLEMNRRGTELLKEGYGRIVEALCSRARSAEQFLAGVLREEFGLDYPVGEEKFQVSSRSDFVLHVGIRKLPRLYRELVGRLLPRRAEEARFLRQCLRQADEDVECNENNMISNYRYRLRESLRPLCGELSDRIRRLGGELDGLTAYLMEQLEEAKSRRDSDRQQLLRVMELTEEIARSGNF